LDKIIVLVEKNHFWQEWEGSTPLSMQKRHEQEGMAPQIT